MKTAKHQEGNVTVQVTESLSGNGQIEIETNGDMYELDCFKLDASNFTTETLTNIGQAFIACAAIIESRDFVEMATPEECADAG